MLTPHDLRIHKLLKLLNPVVRPLINVGTEQRLKKAVNVADFRECAAVRLHKMCFGYLDSGSDDEVTLRRNKDAFTQLELNFKVLAGLQAPLDLSTRLLGQDVKIPFFACPTAGNKMFHLEGEAAVAMASKEMSSLYCLSTGSTTTIEDISKILPYDYPKLFQVYIWKDHHLMEDILTKVKAAGFQSMVLTVDISWFGNRERDVRNNFTIPPDFSPQQVWESAKRPAWTWDFLANPPYTYALINKNVPAVSLAQFVQDQIDSSFTWKDAKWLCQQWQGPKAIKGICQPADAVKAVNCGFTTVWVSNHGGRQLDTSPATIDVLPAVREAVGPEVEIILDGGIQRGTDIAKALALGADGVGIGKPHLYGLAAGGTHGVRRVFETLRTELERTMGLLGVASVQELKTNGHQLVRHRDMSLRDTRGARYAKSGII